MLGKHSRMGYRNAITDQFEALINHLTHRALFIG